MKFQIWTGIWGKDIFHVIFLVNNKMLRMNKSQDTEILVHLDDVWESKKKEHHLCLSQRCLDIASSCCILKVISKSRQFSILSNNSRLLFLTCHNLEIWRTGLSNYYSYSSNLSNCLNLTWKQFQNQYLVVVYSLPKTGFSRPGTTPQCRIVQNLIYSNQL